MKKVILIAILINNLIVLSQKEERNRNQLLTYGYEKFNYETSFKLVGEKYNIELKRIAGSTISKKLKDSAITENSMLWKKMDGKYGIGFEKKFRKEVRTQYQQIQESERILKSSRHFKKLKRKIQKNGNLTQILDSVSTDRMTYYWHVRTHKTDSFNHLKKLKVIVNLKNGACKIFD